MHISTEYNQTYTNNYTYINTVIPPILNLSISLSGKCVDGENALDWNYPIINDTACPIDQRFYNIDKESAKTILNRNGYLETMMAYPLFNLTITDDKKWNFDAEYAFYRNTLTCLMKEYENINSKTSYFGEITKTRTFDIQKEKIVNMLQVFVKFDTSFQYQLTIQILILVVNAFIVLFNVISILSKIFAMGFACCQCLRLFVYYEKLLSFFLDITLAVLGAFSFFVLYQYVTLITTLIDSSCVDNYVQYKFGLFANELQSTAESNLQLFIIVLIKIFMIVFSIVYYITCKRCKLSCLKFWEIIMENINEGDDDNNILIDKKQLDRAESAEINSEIREVNGANNVINIEMANNIASKEYDSDALKLKQ
jgi:hypothetical protein